MTTTALFYMLTVWTIITLAAAWSIYRITFSK